MNGRVIHSGEPICGPQGTDVSANIQTREELERFFEISHDLLCIAGFDGYFKSLNSAWENTLGFTKEELLTTPYLEFVHPEDRKSTTVEAQKVAAGNSSTRFENRYRCKDGSYKWFQWIATPVFDQQLIYAAARDITERKRVGAALRRSEERVRCLVDSNIIGVSIGDLHGKIIDANDAFLRIVGYTRSEILSGKLRWDTITPPGYRDSDQRAIEQIKITGVAHPWEKEFLRKDGSRVAVLIGIATLVAAEGDIECVAFVVDVSERKKLEQQLRQGQKMEAVGRLSGGIAHDFNNLLMVIIGYGELLVERLGENDPLRKNAEEINKAGQRAASLTQQLLAFSRQQVLQPKILDLNSVVADVKKMLGRLISEDIEVTTLLDPNLGRVQADQGQIEQVIVNLAVNARDAMPHGGKLTIETANMEVDDAYAAQHRPMPPGSFIMLSVSDTGIGMDAETQSNIFEPFFTTKERGKGTGLGLATVYGVLKQSDGFIWVDSELGNGTTFKVLLPRVEDRAQAVTQNTSSEGSRKGWETILLVEDEESVRRLILELLHAHGYTVLEAADGIAALNIAQRAHGKIDLLLTDVVMPGMSGTQVAEKVTSLHPETKVLYMSGYTDFAVEHHQIPQQGRLLLRKPFTQQSLARKVREALETTILA
jgi:two-component system cell cycle sensor histidine kinase/response regulator CckA